jgi:hypothetical protein
MLVGGGECEEAETSLVGRVIGTEKEAFRFGTGIGIAVARWSFGPCSMLAAMDVV